MNHIKKKNKFMDYAWVIIVSFFTLGIVDIRFGILGFICMIAPLYHALRGEGKKHCSKYCPRGSFLGTFIKKISLNNSLPMKFRSKPIKHFLLLLMFGLLTFSLLHTDLSFHAIAFVLFRFMFMSFIVGIVLGVFFKPRTWCQVCPMGHAAGLISHYMP